MALYERLEIVEELKDKLHDKVILLGEKLTKSRSHEVTLRDNLDNTKQKLDIVKKENSIVNSNNWELRSIIKEIMFEFPETTEFIRGFRFK